MQPVCVTLNLGRNSVTAALQGEYLIIRAADFLAAGGGLPPSNLPQHRRHLLRHSVSRRHPRPPGADPQQNPWWWQPAATLPRTTRRSTAAARSGTALPRSALPLDFGPCCSVQLCKGLTCTREGSCQFFRLLVLAFVSRALRPRLPLLVPGPQFLLTVPVLARGLCAPPLPTVRSPCCHTLLWSAEVVFPRLLFQTVCRAPSCPLKFSLRSSAPERCFAARLSALLFVPV